MAKLEACTSGRKHKWDFVRNTTRVKHTWGSATFTLAGFYRCPHCGQGKYGNFRSEEIEKAKGGAA